MISFTSFPVQPDYQVQYDSVGRSPADDDMDLDLEEDLEPGGSKLTCPGEALTSAQLFMRQVQFVQWL